MIEAFHFLRPWWLLALLPCCMLVVNGLRARSSGANWRSAITPDLLEYLLDSQAQPQQRRSWWLLLLAWLLASLALAGPTWEKLPQPVLQNRDALVVVLDLSLSMTAADIQPSRIQRARYKALDMLAQRNEGLTGLVVYSGDAHVVTPLTDDIATVTNLVPSLAPDMMPVYGSDVGAGIDQALLLMQGAGISHGHILLLTDGIETSDIDRIASKLRGTRHDFSILGVGTEQGAPIPVNGGFLKQRDGSIVIPQLHGERLQQLADTTSGSYHVFSIDDSDINALLPTTQPDDAMLRNTDREFDQWRERGPWLAVLLLPIAALAFRRGWLLILFALILLPDSRSIAAEPDAAPSSPAQTAALQSVATNLTDQGKLLWRNLWSTPDQQAARSLATGDAKTAATQFSDPAWKASALYRAGDYEQAAKQFQTLRGADGKTPADADYNRGNALARAGQLDAAIAAYNEALKKNPDFTDVKNNRDVVEKLKQQQQKSEPDRNNSGKNNADEKQSEQNQSDQSQSQSGQQNNQSGDSNPQKSDAQHKDGQQSPSKSDPTKQSDSAQKSEENKSSHSKENTKNSEITTQNAHDKAKDKNAPASKSQPAPLTAEQQRQQQVMEQWLRQIPDDPSGLLRRKFDYEHRQQQQRETDSNDDRPIW